MKKVVITGAIIVLLVAVRRHSHKSDPLGGLKPGVYQPNNSGETLPLPTRRSVNGSASQTAAPSEDYQHDDVDVERLGGGHRR